MLSNPRTIVSLGALLAFSILCGCSENRRGLVAIPSAISVVASDAVPAGKVTQVIAVLCNNGRQKLRLLSIRPTCSCTEATLPEIVELDPGQQVPLVLKVAIPLYGSAESTVVIETNSPFTPLIEVKLNIVGDERPTPYVLAQTSRLNLVGSNGCEQVHGNVEIQSIEKHNSEPEFKKMKSSIVQLVAVRRDDVDEIRIGTDLVNRRYRFDITVLCPESGRLVGELNAEFASDVGRVADHRTIVTVDLLRLIAVSPGEISRRPAELAEGFEQMVLAIGKDEVQFRIQQVTWHVNRTCNRSLLKNVEGVESEKLIHKLNLAFPSLLDEQLSDESYIEIETTHPTATLFRIPVRIGDTPVEQ